MFHMNGGKQRLGGRQVLGAIPASGAGSNTRARGRAWSQRGFLIAGSEIPKFVYFVVLWSGRKSHGEKCKHVVILIFISGFSDL